MPVPDGSWAVGNLLVVYPCPAKDFHLDRSHCSIKIWQLAGARGAWDWELAARKRRPAWCKGNWKSGRRIEKYWEDARNRIGRQTQETVWELQPCIKRVTLQVTKSVLFTSHFSVILLRSTLVLRRSVCLNTWTLQAIFTWLETYFHLFIYLFIYFIYLFVVYIKAPE